MSDNLITIKFSHRYTKMPPVLSGTFIKDIALIDYGNLTQEQIDRDTETVDGQHYQLPQTRLIWIKLWSEYGEWATLRRFTPEKYKYYREHIGQEVHIAIIPDPQVKLI